MKLATRKHRVLAVFMGIILLVTLVIQLRREGYSLNMKTVKNFKSNIK